MVKLGLWKRNGPDSWIAGCGGSLAVLRDLGNWWTLGIREFGWVFFFLGSGCLAFSTDCSVFWVRLGKEGTGTRWRWISSLLQLESPSLLSLIFCPFFFIDIQRAYTVSGSLVDFHLHLFSAFQHPFALAIACKLGLRFCRACRCGVGEPGRAFYFRRGQLFIQYLRSVLGSCWEAPLFLEGEGGDCRSHSVAFPFFGFSPSSLSSCPASPPQLWSSRHQPRHAGMKQLGLLLGLSHSIAERGNTTRHCLRFRGYVVLDL